MPYIPQKYLVFGTIFVVTEAMTAFLIVAAPNLILRLGSYVLLVACVLIMLRLSAPNAPFLIRLLFCVVLCVIVLNYGFTNVTVGSGSARLTISELVLMGALMWVMVQSWRSLWIAGLSSHLLLIYALVPFIFHFVPNLLRYGVVAARDALPLVDSFFFFGGIIVVAFARDVREWQQWRQRFLWLVMVALIIYLPLYPFQKTILMYSPVAYGYQQFVPIFGYFANSNAFALAGMLASILLPAAFAWRIGGQCKYPFLMVAFVVYTFGIMMLQSRATYIAMTVSLIILSITGHGRAVWRLLLTIITGIMVLALIEFTGVEVKGRVGAVSLEMLVSQLESVTGSGAHEAGIGGVNQRKGWWRYSLSRWSSSAETIIAGIGFGEPLTDFATGRITGGGKLLVREPHNSYISVLTRTGLVGFLPWLAFHGTLLMLVWRKFHAMRRSKQPGADYWLWMFTLSLSLLIEALVEPVFESPHFAIPYFFLAGIALGEIARDKDGWRSLLSSKTTSCCPLLRSVSEVPTNLFSRRPLIVTALGIACGIFLPCFQGNAFCNSTELPQLPLPPERLAEAPPFLPSLISPSGQRVPLAPGFELKWDESLQQLKSNRKGWWYVNFPDVKKEVVATLAGEPRKTVRNWYWHENGIDEVSPPELLSPPIIARDMGSPNLIVDNRNRRASDRNPGSAAAPLRSIGEAIVRAVPGSIIHVMPGEYREKLVITKSGIKGSPIRIVGVRDADGKLPVFTGNAPFNHLEWKPMPSDRTLYRADVPDLIFGPVFIDGQPSVESSAVNLIASGEVAFSWGAHDLARETSRDELVSAMDKSSYQIVEADQKGWFDLHQIQGSEETSVWVGRAFFFSESSHKDYLLVEGDFRSTRRHGVRASALPNRYRVWFNGESMRPLVESEGDEMFLMPHLSIGPNSGEQTVGVAVKPGWNELLIQMETGSQHGKTRFAVRFPHSLNKTAVTTDTPNSEQPKNMMAISSLSRMKVTRRQAASPEYAIYYRLREGETRPSKNIELPVMQGPLVNIKGNYIELSGFEFRGGAQGSQQGMVEVSGVGNIVDANRFIRPDVRGITISAWSDQESEPIVVSRNWIDSPGHIGIGAAGEPPGSKCNLNAKNLTKEVPGRGRYIIEDNIIRYPNRNGYPVFWESGCIKVVRSTGSIIRGNACIGSNGVGIWLDWENFGNRVESNYIHEAYGCGICVEASPGPNLLANNVIVGTRPGPDWFSAAVLAWDSIRTWAIHNTVDGTEKNGSHIVLGINLQGNTSSPPTRWCNASQGAITQTSSNNLILGSGILEFPKLKIESYANVYEASTLFDDNSYSTAPLSEIKYDFSGLLRELHDPAIGAFRRQISWRADMNAVLDVEFNDGSVKRRVFP